MRSGKGLLMWRRDFQVWILTIPGGLFATVWLYSLIAFVLGHGNQQAPIWLEVGASTAAVAAFLCCAPALYLAWTSRIQNPLRCLLLIFHAAIMLVGLSLAAAWILLPPQRGLLE